jgi:hypothetical protein
MRPPLASAYFFFLLTANPRPIPLPMYNIWGARDCIPHISYLYGESLEFGAK